MKKTNTLNINDSNHLAIKPEKNSTPSIQNSNKSDRQLKKLNVRRKSKCIPSSFSNNGLEEYKNSPKKVKNNGEMEDSEILSSLKIINEKIEQKEKNKKGKRKEKIAK